MRIDDDPIWGFEQFGFLSNFAESPVVFDGVVYPTVEHAYQAAKTTDELARVCVASESTPGRAKRAGQSLVLRDDWEHVKVDVMSGLVAQKFAPGTVLAAALCGTCPRRIVEANSWGDTFWGVDAATGLGENTLGRILMDVRERVCKGTC